MQRSRILEQMKLRLSLNGVGTQALVSGQGKKWGLVAMSWKKRNKGKNIPDIVIKPKTLERTSGTTSRAI